MMRTLDWRRAQRERIRQRRLRRIPWLQRTADLLGEYTIIGVAIDTPCRCSGPCCGNPRRWFGTRTPDERRIDAEAAGEDPRSVLAYQEYLDRWIDSEDEPLIPSGDWMEIVPDIYRDPKTIPHRTVNGRGVVGRLVR